MIIKIDDPLADLAVRTGEKIGVVCTTQTTLGPSQNLIREHAARHGKQVETRARLETAAFEVVMAGDKARHDELVKQAATELGRECDVIVLAQASMAHLVPELSQLLSVPVLASPDICVEALAGFVADAYDHRRETAAVSRRCPPKTGSVSAIPFFNQVRDRRPKTAAAVPRS